MARFLSYWTVIIISVLGSVVAHADDKADLEKKISSDLLEAVQHGPGGFAARQNYANQLRLLKPEQMSTFLTIAHCLKWEPSSEIRITLLMIFSENAAAFRKSPRSYPEMREMIIWILDNVAYGNESSAELERDRYDPLVSRLAQLARQKLSPEAHSVPATLSFSGNAILNFRKSCRRLKTH